MFKLLLFGCSRVLLHNWFPRSSSPLIVQCFLSGNLTVFFSLAFSLRPVRARWEQKPARPRRHHRHRPEAWTRIHWMPGLSSPADAGRSCAPRRAARRAAGAAEGARPEDPGRMEPCGKFVFIRVRKVFFCVRLVCHQKFLIAIGKFQFSLGLGPSKICASHDPSLHILSVNFF